MLDDTIAAISTPMGEGGIGIVRLSGGKAVAIVDSLFVGRLKVSEFQPQTLHYGGIIDPASGELVDEVLVSYMPAPRSYTREDVIEINCHGGILPLQKILELTLKQGARLAQPGEFTKRAFLNGRIDLAQAEAVVEIIRAKSEAALKEALHQLKGGLSKKVHSLREALIDILSRLEVLLDFEEEEIQPLDYNLFCQEIEGVKRCLQQLIETAQRGKFLREGINTIILGRPNVGKSSLLNALLGWERAIVTDIPGTTRDTIEEIINLDGIPLRVIDTAGIRKTDQVVEQEGVKRTLDSLDYADLVLLVLDANQPLNGEDEDIARRIGDKPTIVILNKIDLPLKIDLDQIKRLFPGRPVVKISALHNMGLEGIKEEIKSIFFAGRLPMGDSPVVILLRHKQALEEASLSLDRAIKAAERKESLEFIALDLRGAIDSLGEILGEKIDEEVLDRIFSQFCIGK